MSVALSKAGADARARRAGRESAASLAPAATSRGVVKAPIQI